MKLSIIIPVFNEAKTIKELLLKLKETNLPVEKEIIVVDDGSKDGTSEILKNIDFIKVIEQRQNLGKGRAIKIGIQSASGDIIIFQDADLEYDPVDYPRIIAPITNRHADVVYGSRFLKNGNTFFTHTRLANNFLSFLTSVLTSKKITDMETCYKAFKTPVLKQLNLKENGFGIEPEITMKVLKIKEIKYMEVPISYRGRSVKEGKKVRWTDGVWAIWCILRYRFWN